MGGEGREGRVAGVVLAAGSSSRMGANKLLLPLSGSTVLRRAVEAALGGGLDPVLVVLGHERERVGAALDGLACLPVVNPDHARGLNASLRAGVAAVPGYCLAAVVLLGDMPFVTAEMVAAVVARFRTGTAPLVLSVYGDVLAPPTLYARALFPELSASEGEGCGKRVMKRHRGQALEVAWPAEALADLDVPADVDLMRGRLEGS
jgi:molybdenum cofactor cytidylyltransferase